MSKCHWCNQEMTSKESTTCTFPRATNVITMEVRDRLPYLPEGWTEELDQRCHDCGVRVGGYHHPGCDMEICPFCGGQLLACPCVLEPTKPLESSKEAFPKVNVEELKKKAIEESNGGKKLPDFWARYEEIRTRLKEKGLTGQAAAWHDLAVELHRENKVLWKEKITREAKKKDNLPTKLPYETLRAALSAWVSHILTEVDGGRLPKHFAQVYRVAYHEAAMWLEGIKAEEVWEEARVGRELGLTQSLLEEIETLVEGASFSSDELETWLARSKEAIGYVEPA